MSSVDNNLRQKLSRCVNDKLSYKDRFQALKKAFGGIQDPQMKQTQSQKGNLMINDGIEALISIIRCDNHYGPQLESGMDIWEPKGSESKIKYQFQSCAVLYLRRMCEIGDRELTTGLVRLDTIVNMGIIEVLIPHLYCPECASGFASGVLKEICRYEAYRPRVIQSHALYPLCLLLTSERSTAINSIRNSAECLHLLACTCSDMMLSYSYHLPSLDTSSGRNNTFISNNIHNIITNNTFQHEHLIQFCLNHVERELTSNTSSTTNTTSSASSSNSNTSTNNSSSTSQSSTNQHLLNTILCLANLTAGYENVNNKTVLDIESIYKKIELGTHICRALYSSLNNSVPYLSMRWSYIDILNSILLLVSSNIGKKQLQNSGVKSTQSNRRLNIIDLLTIAMKKSFELLVVDELKIVLEILLHFVFEESISMTMKNTKECVETLRKIYSFHQKTTTEGEEKKEHGEEDNEGDLDNSMDGSNSNSNSNTSNTVMTSNSSSKLHQPIDGCRILSRHILFVLNGKLGTTICGRTGMGERAERGERAEESRIPTRPPSSKKRNVSRSSKRQASKSEEKAVKKTSSFGIANNPSRRSVVAPTVPSKSSQPSASAAPAVIVKEERKRRAQQAQADQEEEDAAEEAEVEAEEIEEDEEENYEAQEERTRERAMESNNDDDDDAEFEAEIVVADEEEEAEASQEMLSSVAKESTSIPIQSAVEEMNVTPSSSLSNSSQPSKQFTAPSQPITQQPPPYIMISYCWANQPLVFEICRQLKLLDISYWLDVEKMYGNINDRMAEAIESCVAVLVCVSSKYKLSANCRMEAEYSNTQKKHIIPLMVEENYHADGWLGLLISGKLYYEMSSMDGIRQNVSAVMTELQPILEREVEERKSRPAAVIVKTESANLPSYLSADSMDGMMNDDMTVNSDSKYEDSTVSQYDASENQTYLSMETMRGLLNGMEERLQGFMSNQIESIESHLTRIDRRLDELETKMTGKKK